MYNVSDWLLKTHWLPAMGVSFRELLRKIGARARSRRVLTTRKNL